MAPTNVRGATSSGLYSRASHAFTHIFPAYITFPVAELIRIPSGMDLAGACPILCAGVTAYTSLRIMSPVPGRWCVIVGAAGGLGHLAIQYAKAMNLKVLALDGGLPEKESFCMRMGADVFVDFTRGRVVETVRDKTQGGADYVLVLSPLQSCYKFASPR
jgi:alcohol dehydrogenase, propanol-preferring